MIIKKIFLFGLLLSALGGLFAAAARLHWWKSPPPETRKDLPDASAEYRKIMDRYMGRDSISNIAGTISIYDGENRYSLKEQKTFRFIKAGRQYYSQLSYLQTFCNGDMILQLDTVNRYITVTKAAHDQTEAKKGNGPFDLLFNDTSRFKITGTVSEQDGERVLRMHSDFHPGIRSSSLIYDTADYRLYKAEIEWWKDPLTKADARADKIWLAKIDYRYEPFTGLDIGRKIREVIVMDGGRIILRPQYKDYQISVGF